MTAADVNVTELVARALYAPYTGEEAATAYYDDERPWVQRLVAEDKPILRAMATAALAALRSPEVLAGIAGVLGRHTWAGWDEDGQTWRCGDCDAALGDATAMHDALDPHQARAVVEWIAGADR